MANVNHFLTSLNFRAIAWTLGLALPISACGCGVGEVQLTEGVAAVAANKSVFAQDEDDPMRTIPSDRAGDSVDLLNGCWGAYARTEFFDGRGEDFEFYEFDLENGKARYEVHTRGPGTTQTLVIYEYELVVLSANKISIDLYTALAAANLPNAFVTTTPTSIPLDPAETEPLALQVYVDGDRFKFANALDASPDFSAPHRSNLVFVRLECP